MTREEAITLLNACLPLTYRLAVEGLEIELTIEEQAALQGFNQVFVNDRHWLKNFDVISASGLNHAKLGFLILKGRRERKKEMRRQHAGGEQLD